MEKDRRSLVPNLISYLVIGAISAGATGYVTIARIEERVASLNTRMDRIEAVQEQRYNSLQEDLRRLYTLLDNHSTRHQ